MLLRFIVEGDFLRVPALSSFEQTPLHPRLPQHFPDGAGGDRRVASSSATSSPTCCTRRRGQLLGVLLSLVLIPFWISIIVRTYALLVVLGRNGIVNSALIELGVVDEPLRIMFSTGAVYIGMAQALLPFMVLSIYSSLRGIDPDLPLAARALGAGGATGVSPGHLSAQDARRVGRMHAGLHLIARPTSSRRPCSAARATS